MVRYAGNRSTRADIVHGVHEDHMVSHVVRIGRGAVHDVGTRRMGAVVLGLRHDLQSVKQWNSEKIDA